MLKSKPLIILVSILLIIFTGYIRDSLFVSINNFLYYKFENLPIPLDHYSKAVHVFSYLGYWQLYILKWVFTILFSVVYFFITVLAIKQLFHKNLFRQIGFVYLAFMTVSFLLMLTGWLIADFSYTYKFSRYLMGMIQSPLLFMFFSAALFFDEQKKTTT